MTFGYIAETPIWRTTLPARRRAAAKDGAQLQGWALVHNDTDERWQGVHLELVNGEPDSFLFPLAAPRYARRTLVHPETPLSTMPQLQGTTADALWGDHLDAVTARVRAAARATAEGTGGSAARTSRMRRPSNGRDAATTDTGGSSVLSVGNLAELAPAQGVENGALFVYAVPGAFALDAHASALVPFLDKPVKTENIAFFADRGRRRAPPCASSTAPGRRSRPVRSRSSAQAGSPARRRSTASSQDERRFLQFGNDLDAEVTSKTSDRSEESKRLTFAKDRLEEHFLATTDHDLGAREPRRRGAHLLRGARRGPQREGHRHRSRRLRRGHLAPHRRLRRAGEEQGAPQVRRHRGPLALDPDRRAHRKAWCESSCRRRPSRPPSS